jgi:predicted nucleic acid-binding protein
MSRLVVDASVAIKWHFQREIHSEDALRILYSIEQAVVPDLFYIEMENIIWKYTKSKKLPVEKALTVVESLMAQNSFFQCHSSQDALDLIFELSVAFDISAYDATYLALAIRENIQCVTADRKLYDKIRASKLRNIILWIED